MAGQPLRVLAVEDDENDLLLVVDRLSRGGYDPDVHWVQTLSALAPALAERSFDVVLSDFDLDGFDGLAVLHEIRRSCSDLPFILVSGVIGEETAVAAMRAGAHDYIMKDKMARLVPAIRRELGEAEERRQRRRAEEALLRERERAAVTLASIGDGVVRTDASGRLEYLNPTAVALTGWTQQEAVGQEASTVLKILDARSRRFVRPPVAHCLRERRHCQSSGERLLLGRDGSEVPIRDSAAPILDGDGEPTGAVVILRNLSKQLDLERRMAHLERHDPITDLGNRRAFDEALHAACASARDEGRRHVLCLLDLDRFKVINDTCGHGAGDTMLRRVASILRERLGDAGTVARLGADDFGLLLPDAELADGRKLCEELLALVPRSRFSWSGTLCTATASIGLVAIEGDGPGAAEALRAADAACCVARERGGDRCHEHMPEDAAVARLHGGMRWVTRLHEALDEGHFELWAQPIHSLAGTTDVPALWEVLLRLRDDRGSLIMPDEFTPAAERYHLMPLIDRWVVGKTLEVLSTRAVADDDGVSYAINLSGQSLSDEPFLDFVTDRLEASNVEPGRLCFEITETAAVESLAQATRFLSVLHGLGCRFALDDFGTGFSSFAYLRSMSFDYLKIDGSFVREMEDPLQRAVVGCINQISHLMGIRTIAEWIEDQQTLVRMQEIGVDFGQGWHLGRPVQLVEALGIATRAVAP